MARPQSVDDEQIILRLSGAFRDVGYHAASMEALSAATGLKKASLYHRFPGGKQQMAEEVIAAALVWFDAHVFVTLKGAGTPRERLAIVTRNLNEFYDSGRQACLLNMLATPHDEAGPFAPAIKAAFEALIAAFSALASQAGYDTKSARSRAERTVMLLHGSLVLARGLGSPLPFQTFLRSFADDLIGDRPK